MRSRFREMLSAAMRINPEDNVRPEVAANFKHSVIYNTLDLMFFFLADSFVSINTIMPVFAATLTDSPIIIGLIPAIANAGWFLPQLFMAGYVGRLKRKVPFVVKMAVLERLPYLLFPILALLIPSLSRSTAVTILLILMVARGLGGGLTALPWQELMATVIPISHRSRFYGFSRVFAQSMGVLGSSITAVVLSGLAYPTNYAVGFIIAVIAQWISFYFFSKNRDPEPPASPEYDESKDTAEPGKERLTDWGLIWKTIRRDSNLRIYLSGQSILFLGRMASAYLAVYGLQRFNLDDGHAALYTGLIFFSGIIGYAIFGALGDRIGPKRNIEIAMLLWILSLIIALTAPTPWIYDLIFVLFGLYTAAMVVGDSVLAMELGEESQRTIYIGIARTSTGIFILAAPFLAGWLVNHFNYPTMFVASIVFSLIGTLLISRVRDVPRRGLRNSKQAARESNEK